MNLRDIVNAATPGPWTVGERRPPLEWERDLRATAGDGSTYLHGAMAEDVDAEFVATFDPQLVGRLLDIVDAARHFVDQRGWAPLVGRPGRCIDCHASIDADEHCEHCNYDAMRKTIVALLDALGATEVTA